MRLALNGETLAPEQSGPVQPDAQGLFTEPKTVIKAEVLPSAISDDATENEDELLDRLVAHFQYYRDDPLRIWNMTRWNAVYRAYHGIQLRPAPYRKVYFIRECFRQIETVKPLIINAFMPGDEWMKYLAEHPGEEDGKAAASRIVHKQLRSARSGIATELELMKFLENGVMWGTSYLTTGWAKYRFTRMKSMLLHEDTDLTQTAWERHTEEIEAGCPYGETLMPWEVFSHGEVEDPRRSPYVFVQKIVSVSDLHTLQASGYLDEARCKDALDNIKELNFPMDDVNTTRPNGQNNPAMYTASSYLQDADIHDHPHELLTVWTNSGWEYVVLDRLKILRAQRLPKGRMPLHCIRNYPQANEHWGIPELVPILEDQNLMNDFTSMYVDSYKYSTCPIMLTKRGQATKSWDDANFRPGSRIPLDNIADVQALQMPEAPERQLNGIQFIRSNMMRTSGVTDEISGTGTDASTATGQMHLEAAAGVRIRHKVRWFSPTMRNIFQEFYDLNGENYSNEDQELLRMEGEDGKLAFVDASPDVFNGTVEVQLMEQLTQTTVEEKNVAIQAVRLFLNDPMTNQMKLREDFWRVMGKPKPKQYLSNPATSGVDALSENENWKGIHALGDPQPSDDHATHVQIHQMALQLSQGQVPMNAVAAMVQHIRLHMAYLQYAQKQQAQQAQTQGPQQAQGMQPRGTPPAQSQANANTEAAMSNGMRGAAQQGALPAA